MMRAMLFAGAGALLATAVAAAAPEEAQPAGVVSISVGGPTLTLWPYTFQEPAAPGSPSDPVNLVFLDSDPREIRQALMALDGNRGLPLQLPFGQCRWTDSLGNEQAAWADAEGWVGSEVQLACVVSNAPLGNPFRFHLRLFRQGSLTLGGAHFEVLISGTADHEVLSWDFARNFVAADMARTGALSQDAQPVQVVAAGTFRSVRWPIYAGLVNGGAGAILNLAGLPAPVQPPQPPLNPLFGSNVEIPTDGAAVVLAPQIELQPTQAKTHTTVQVNYGVVTTRPFCGNDFVLLQGPVRFDIDVHTNPSGMYSRTEVVSGSLTVTPMRFTGSTFVPSGAPSLPAVVTEFHRALLTDNYGEATQEAAQTLLGDPVQALVFSLAAGHVDGFANSVSCGVP